MQVRELQIGNFQRKAIANLVRSQVYHTERPPICLQHVRRDAVHRVGLSATADLCSVLVSK